LGWVFDNEIIEETEDLKELDNINYKVVLLQKLNNGLVLDLLHYITFCSNL